MRTYFITGVAGFIGSNLAKKILKENGSDSSLMSGSGPSVYGVFHSKSKAESCFENIKKIYPETFLCNFISHGVKIL